MTVGLRVVVVWWLACLIWSSTWLFIRMGPHGIPPLTFPWMRLAFALAVLEPFALRRAAWPSLRKGDLASVALGAVILDERLPVLTLVGAVLALIGVACVLVNARFDS